ncbi:MAG: MraY family glycosyltransferase [Candidatus Methanofastidiosia archaeon]
MSLAVVGILSFAVTFVATFLLISIFGKRGIVGTDRHKLSKPKIPEMGGIAVFVGITSSYLYLLFEMKDNNILLALSSLSIIFIVGIVDDIYAVRQKIKLLLLFLSGVPLLFASHRVIDLGVMQIGYLPLYLVCILVGMAAASNLTNILAGFNGEATGLGVISTGFLIADSIVLKNDIVFWILTPVFFSLLAFLFFNRHPAKVFPGDAGTLLIGGSIGVASILGGIELLGIIVLMPQIIEFFLKLQVRFKGVSYGPTQVRSDGTLTPPPYPSLANILTGKFVLTEPKLVALIWTGGAAFGLASYLVASFGII